MITKPTVFILGAGASSPYGYPLGRALFQQVLGALKAQPNSPFVEMGYSQSVITSFRKDLFASGRTSVDAFLEHRPEFEDIGKAAIAFALIRKENENALHEDSEGRWYKYFYGKLTNLFEDFGDNKVSIITYNYDRSLEQFLFNSLKSSYGKNDVECAKQLGKIPIIHLHGRLDHLPWQSSSSGRLYWPHKEREIIKASATKIRIIYEDIDLDSDLGFVEARKLLKNAERVYFLGFGYNATNLRRLRVDEWASTAGVSGSTYGLVRNEHREIHKAFGDKIVLDYMAYDVLDFLKNCAVWD